MTGSVHIGVGGWTYAPWRGTFYPEGLRQADELAHAARALSGLEINGTYYRLQKPATFAKWAAAAPDGFRFGVKASRYATNRRDLREAGEAVAKFCVSGLVELGDRLGPLLWQLAPTKRFDPDEMEAFLAMLPAAQDGVALRHAIEVRHESFADPAFIALARKYAVAIVTAEHEAYPQIADRTADFVYARLMLSSPDHERGYPEGALRGWSERIGIWRSGGRPDGLTYVTGSDAGSGPRDVFAFFIGGEKVRNPAAATRLTALCRR